MRKSFIDKSICYIVYIQQNIYYYCILMYGCNLIQEACSTLKNFTDE